MNVNDSPMIRNANIAPNNDASEKRDPVRVEPIFFIAKYTRTNENPTIIKPMNSR